MIDTGATSGTFEVPNDSVAMSFPHEETTESPNSSMVTPPTEAGLGGQPTLSLHPSQQPAPTQPEEHPAATAARGVFAALSGAGGHPMDWARATIAGGLAAAANLGKSGLAAGANVTQGPAGSGWLVGAAQGAQGVQQRDDQLKAAAAKQQQQQFENAEKQKADARAQQELQNSTDRTKAEVGLTTAQTLASIQTRQQNAALFPTLQKEKQLQMTDLENKIQDSEKEGLSLLAAHGVDITKLQHVTDTNQLTASDAHQAGSGSVFPAGNGEAHSADEDKFGAYVVPQSVWAQKMPTDGVITVSAGIDKDGHPITKQQPYQAGTTVGTLWAIIRGSQKNYEDQENQIIAEAKKQQEVAKGAGAATDEKLKQGLTGSEIEKNLAEAKAAGAKTETASDKPIYAYNNQTKQTELTTRADMNAKPGVYTNPVSVKQSDIEKDKEASLQLNDAQMNLTRAKLAYDKYEHLGPIDQRAVAAILGDDKFKGQVGLFGTHAEIPVDWLNKLLNSENYQQLSPQAQAAVTGYLGLKSAAIAYQKAVTKSGRSSDKSLAIEEAMLPDPTLPKAARASMMDRFQENVNQVSKGLPLIPGVERPGDVRGNLEKEDAAKQGATHVYNPASGQAEPVKNIFGKVIGYKGADGQLVRTQ